MTKKMIDVDALLEWIDKNAYNRFSNFNGRIEVDELIKFTSKISVPATEPQKILNCSISAFFKNLEEQKTLVDVRKILTLTDVYSAREVIIGDQRNSQSYTNIRIVFLSNLLAALEQVITGKKNVWHNDN